MKLTTGVLVLALIASASAQQKPNDQPAPVKSGTVQLKPLPAKPAATQQKPAAQNAATTKTAAPAAQKTAPTAKPTTATTKPAVVPAKKPVVVATKPAPAPVKKTPMTPKVTAKKSAPKKVAPVVAKKEKEEEKKAPEEAATAKVEKAAPVARSKRDPFQTVIVDRTAAGGACSGGGKQCLIPDEVYLKGIVRSNGAILAVVTTKDNRAYFLRENDPVMNGVVTRITEGSITFRERTTDVFGKQVMREVVKKINPAAA